MWTGVAAGLAAVSGFPVAAVGAATPSGVAAAPDPLTLVSQTPWVATGGSFDVRFRVGATAPAAAQLGVAVSVYACLSSVSAFDQSVNPAAGPEGTPIDSTATPLALAGLPATGDGALDLAMPVAVGGGGTPPAGGFAINLVSRGGQCGAYPAGVYPVRIQLVDTANGQTVGGITTHLVYTGTPAATQRLRVAVVLPLATTLGPARGPGTAELAAHPSAALVPPTAAAVASVTGTVTVVADQHPTVPLTLVASPQTVAELGATGHQTTVDDLATLAATPAVHQFATAPFVPVNAAGLVTAGLGGELALQVARGSQVLAAVLPHALSPAPTWFANDGLDAATVSQLQGDGYHQAVVPAVSVPGSPTNDSTAEPFALGPSSGPSMVAVASSADLTARFTGAPGDPALAASQLAAELAQIYFEKPNDITPRIVAVTAPAGWVDDPTFVSTLLDALDGNPVLQAIGAADLFTTLPVAPCHTTCRTVAGTGTPGLPTAAIGTQRQRIAALSTAATGPVARGLTTQLDDLVLSGESERLRPGQQAGVLHNTGRAVDAQLGQVQVTGDRTVTLTSQRGRVPVTITSSAPYPVTGTLTLTSDKLTFPNGQSQSVVLGPRTNVVYFNVETRASGLFKVGIAVTSPSGGLVLTSGQVSVRSTATSVVGVALTVGAVVVLVVWWLRTSRKRRAQRRSR